MNLELILGIVGIVGSLIGAWAYVQKREADTRAKQADTSLRDAETRAKQAEADAAQINGLMDMFKQQLLINQQQTDRDKVWADMLREKETRDERNYQVLKGLGDDNTRYLSGQLETLNENISGQMETLNKNILAALETIPAKIETISVALATEIGQQIGARVADEIFRRVPGEGAINTDGGEKIKSIVSDKPDSKLETIGKDGEGEPAIEATSGHREC